MNFITVKQCSKCRLYKDLSAFGQRKERHNGDGLHSHCKSCTSEYHKARYMRIRDEELQRCAALSKKYRADWELFFIQTYGSSPQCELCGTPLKYNGKRGDKNIVHWDHRLNGLEEIRVSPKSWLANRSCSAENQAIWKQSGFGILCSLCNVRIPTMNRIAWLDKLRDYILRDQYGARV